MHHCGCSRRVPPAPPATGLLCCCVSMRFAPRACLQNRRVVTVASAVKPLRMSGETRARTACPAIGGPYEPPSRPSRKQTISPLIAHWMHCTTARSLGEPLWPSPSLIKSAKRPLLCASFNIVPMLIISKRQNSREKPAAITAGHHHRDVRSAVHPDPHGTLAGWCNVSPSRRRI